MVYFLPTKGEKVNDFNGPLCTMIGKELWDYITVSHIIKVILTLGLLHTSNLAHCY